MKNVYHVSKYYENYKGEIVMDGNEKKIESGRPGLLTSSHSYKPFQISLAYDFWKRQQQVHWMPEEVPLGEDCKDWVLN